MLTLYLGNKIQGKPRAVTLEVDKKKKKKENKPIKTKKYADECYVPPGWALFQSKPQRVTANLDSGLLLKGFQL